MGLSLLWQGNNLERLLNGLAITAEIAFISVFFACIFGVIFGVVMTSKNKLVQAISHFYLEFIRIIPLLALLFITYFGLAKWFDVHLSGITVCIIVFIFWGTALGLTKLQTFRYILLPQSIKRVTPSAINLFTRMVKTSSLAMLIGVLEVIKVGQQIIETSLFTDPTAALWIYGVIFGLYFVICYPLSLVSKFLENKWE